MNDFNPTQKPSASSTPESPLRAFNAGPNAANEAPLRGEIFDVTIDQNGEAAPATAAPRSKGGWFLAALAAVFFAYNAGGYMNQKSKVPAPIGPFSTKNEALPPMRVQVAGVVKKPGVYSLTTGARIEDALKKAGGALPSADLNGLNLADWAVDGSKIEIPAKSSAKTPTPTPRVIIKEVFITPPQNAPETSQETPRSYAADVSPAAGSQLRSSPKTATSLKKEPAKTQSAPAKIEGKSSPAALKSLQQDPIDLNRASAEQLAVLPGVGPKMAERILAYRKENGGFKSIDDLDNVRGIGEKRMEVLKDLVKVK